MCLYCVTLDWGCLGGTLIVESHASRSRRCGVNDFPKLQVHSKPLTYNPLCRGAWSNRERGRSSWDRIWRDSLQGINHNMSLLAVLVITTRATLVSTDILIDIMHNGYSHLYSSDNFRSADRLSIRPANLSASANRAVMLLHRGLQRDTASTSSWLWCGALYRSTSINNCEVIASW